MSGFFVPVRFAAFLAGCVAIATQAHRSNLILPFKGVKVKLVSREIIHNVRYYSPWPFGAAFLYSDNPVLFKIAQEAAPAAFVERCDMLGDKVADTLLAFLHLANINRFIAR